MKRFDRKVRTTVDGKQSFTTIQVLVGRLLCLPDKQIAARLGRGIRSVEKIASELRLMTGTSNRTSLLIWLIGEGIVHIEDIEII